MTGKELHEQITAFVADRIDEADYRRKVDQQVRPCDDCRTSYETELASRMTVRDPSARPSASDRIGGTLGPATNGVAGPSERSGPDARAAARPGFIDRFAEDFLTPVGVIISLVLVGLGVWALLPKGDAEEAVQQARPARPAPPPQRSASTGPQNFVNNASEEFQFVLTGETKPGISSSSVEEVGTFLRDNGVAFQPSFPSVSAKLVGGGVGKRGSVSVARLHYEAEGRTMVIFQLPPATLLEGSALYLTPDAIERLEGGEWVWQQPKADQSLALFKSGGVICAAVADVNRTTAERILPAPTKAP